MFETRCPGCSIRIRLSRETVIGNPVCPKCDTPLVIPLPPAPPPILPQVPPPVPLSLPDEPDPEYILPPRKKGPPFVTIGVLAALVIACVVGIVFVVKMAGEHDRRELAKKNATNKQEKTTQPKAERFTPAPREERREPPPRDFSDDDSSSADEFGKIVRGFICILILLPIYFAPIFIAAFRRHNNLAPIVIVNFFLGWLFIGWVVALAWSLSDMNPHRKGPA